MLINKQQRKTMQAEYGRLMDNRCTGRTTAASLELISWCIKHPGKAGLIYDHHGSKEANRYMKQIIATSIERLDLVGFTFQEKKGRLTVTFDAKGEYL